MSFLFSCLKYMTGKMGEIFKPFGFYCVKFLRFNENLRNFVPGYIMAE